jgi:beta-lactamase family protein
VPTAIVPRHVRRAVPSILGLLAATLAFGLLAAPAQAERDCTANHRASLQDAPSPLRGICSYLDGRDGVVQVALWDQRAGRLYRLSNGDDTQYTASIVKVDILAKWLRTYDKQGASIPDDIPYSIKYLMQRMIQNSDNAAATSLFYFGGGCDSLTKFNRRIPMDDTKVGCQTPSYYGWGNTTTTAADQAQLMRVFAYGRPKGVLSSDAQDYGNQLMQGVEPDQRFGITCGPWGNVCSPPNYAKPDPDVTVSVKNGWKTLPTCTKPVDQCPWQVNSTGWVRGKGRNYVLTVLTTRDPVGGGGTDGFNYGIDTIQNLSQLVWANLGANNRGR